jgi:very-short-patch-repair endonuclease
MTASWTTFGGHNASQGVFTGIEDALKRADEDTDAARQAQTKLQDVKASLDPIEDKLHWQRLRDKYYDDWMFAQNIVRLYGNERDNQQLQMLADEAEEAILQRDARLLKEKMKAIVDHAWRVRLGAREFWIDLLQHLAEREAQLTDRARARELIAAGWGALRSNDDEMLKPVTWELWDYLPQEEKRKSPYASVGIRRTG